MVVATVLGAGASPLGLLKNRRLLDDDDVDHDGLLVDTAAVVEDGDVVNASLIPIAAARIRLTIANENLRCGYFEGNMLDGREKRRMVLRRQWFVFGADSKLSRLF